MSNPNQTQAREAATAEKKPLKKDPIFLRIARWFDGEAGNPPDNHSKDKIDWIRLVPFWGLHLMCFGVIWVGWSWIAVAVAAAFYFIRMFAITGFYHRYFSHRSFKTSRFAQFLFALLGGTATQRGPLWWAAHHRHHHRYSDQDPDEHSPITKAFLVSHVFWFTYRRNYDTKWELIKDFGKFPELRFLDRYDILMPVVSGVFMYFLGFTLNAFFPWMGTSGMQMLIWGYFISTVVLFHGTQTINSLAHLIGKKRYKTGDESRNSLLLALITLGEGWHNNHHYFQVSTRQGFYWYEVDITYYLLWTLSKMGIIWDLKPVPKKIRENAEKRYDRAPSQMEKNGDSNTGEGPENAKPKEREQKAKEPLAA